MAPEHEAQRAFYDHESDEPHRRRRPAADWGVGDDIFDRMPSRRFTRADRRAEHREDDTRRFARAESNGAPRRGERADDAARGERADWGGDDVARERAAGRGRPPRGRARP